ncbi:DNA-directed RNA polymerase, mitochondrial-like [Mytilus edulis]|uniref:DNA-directed RNA polymerase, mitochondrial-like n=1 Tax=Mytilus edulis TaxID=6550 RepID=UPI0039EFB3A3
MSQILRLCCSSLYSKPIASHVTYLPLKIELEVIRLQGCNNCRAFRSNNNRGQGPQHIHGGVTMHVPRHDSFPSVRHKNKRSYGKAWFKEKEYENKINIEKIMSKGINYKNVKSSSTFEGKDQPYLHIDGWENQLKKFQKQISHQSVAKEPEQINGQLNVEEIHGTLQNVEGMQKSFPSTDIKTVNINNSANEQVKHIIESTSATLQSITDALKDQKLGKTSQSFHHHVNYNDSTRTPDIEFSSIEDHLNTNISDKVKNQNKRKSHGKVRTSVQKSSTSSPKLRNLSGSLKSEAFPSSSKSETFSSSRKSETISGSGKSEMLSQWKPENLSGINFSEKTIGAVEDFTKSIDAPFKSGSHVMDSSKDPSKIATKSKTSKKHIENIAKQKKDWSQHLDINNKTVQDIERKNVIFNMDFRFFVDACLFSDLADKAYFALRFNRHKQFKKPEYAITDNSIYSTLLQHYAVIGDITKMEEIMDCLKEQPDIKPSLQCYSAFLSYLGRQTQMDLEMGQEILNEISSLGYDVKNIFNECVMRKNERQIILNALNQLIEDFVPNSPEGPRPYSGPLLQPLNEQVDLSQVQEMNPYHGVVTPEYLLEQTKKQMDLEKNDVIYVKTIEKKRPLTEMDIEMKNKLEKLKKNWRNILLCAFEKEIERLVKSENGSSDVCVSPFLKMFKPEEYVDLMMTEVERLCLGSGGYSPSANYLWLTFGKRIYQMCLIRFKDTHGITDQILKQYNDFAELYTREDFPFNNQRECWQELGQKYIDGPSADLSMKRWSDQLKKKIGKTLYELIMYKLTIDGSVLSDDGPEHREHTKNEIPAFYYVYRSYKGKSKAEVKPHPIVLKLHDGNYIQDIPFETSELPMLVPPIPWHLPDRGGYLLNQPKTVRMVDRSMFNNFSVIESVPSHKLNGVFDALNILDMCPWIINKPMLEVVIDLFNKKGDKNLDIPRPPSECPAPPKISPDMTPAQKNEIKIKRGHLKQQKSEMNSLWCSALYKLSIANQYKDDIFWFPHNLDFRGRTYPCPPHFNHLGDDVTRSILCFAKGKPLGKKGLDWLKIHLINLTGLKKRSSNKERLAYADELLHEILDSADNPMDGNRWWQASDEPWQTLAACKEIANAVRSSDIEKYICHFPVHQDGSCNGLQHYAALGRDKAGAESVNLFPFEAPKDVYSDVAELVEKVRLTDAANGDEIAQVLEGFVRRKVIKQTVMTTVYGVTRYGARYQILRQLKDIPEFPEKHQWKASHYLTEATFSCLQRMFTSTKMIQDWFTECADMISKTCNKPVEWVTPLDLPVLQPYFKQKTVNLKGITKLSAEFDRPDKPNSQKQKNGFPPNYIHSLDSVHMMLTALYCWRAGITYVSVHDCYWTHPCDVDIMNKICREQFIALHSQPILEDLSKFMLERFGDIPKDITLRALLKECLSRVPTKGTFDLNSVQNSTYFFS